MRRSRPSVFWSWPAAASPPFGATESNSARSLSSRSSCALRWVIIAGRSLPTTPPLLVVPVSISLAMRSRMDCTCRRVTPRPMALCASWSWLDSFGGSGASSLCAVVATFSVAACAGCALACCWFCCTWLPAAEDSTGASLSAMAAGISSMLLVASALVACGFFRPAAWITCWRASGGMVAHVGVCWGAAGACAWFCAALATPVPCPGLGA